MINPLLCGLLFLLALQPLVHAVRVPQKALQYPCWVAAGCLFFLLPQAVSLTFQIQPAPTLAFTKSFNPAPHTLTIVLFLLILTLAAVRFGYHLHSKLLIRYLMRFTPNSETRLTLSAIVLLLISLFANIALWNSSAGDLHRFAQPHLLRELAYPALALLFWRYLTRPTKGTLLLLLLALVTPTSLILGFARREATTRLVVTFLLGLYFWKARKPQPRVLISAVVVLLLFLGISGAYRSCVAGTSCEIGLHSLAPMLFDPFRPEQQTLELREAGHLIELTSQELAYEYGRGYIDHAIHSLLPASLIGHEQKASLISPAFLENYQRYRAWSPSDSRGVPWTGIGDTFLQFSYAGFLVFLWIALVMRSIWLAATRSNSLTAQILYILLLPTAVRALLHGSYVFTTEAIYWGVTLLLVLLISKTWQQTKTTE